MCHEDCQVYIELGLLDSLYYGFAIQDSGKVVEALAGWVGAYRWQRSKGSVLGNGASIETVRNSWSELMDFKDGDYPGSHQEATMDVIMRLNQAKSGVNILLQNIFQRE